MNTHPDLAEGPAVTRNHVSIALLVALFVLLVFFRQQILNHFSFLSSDRYDGVIEVALLEHWFNALSGLSEWSSPNYFFLHEKTLGYNEGLFLYGLIYSAFRFFSVDPFLSSELVNVVVKAIGFAGFLARLVKCSSYRFGGHCWVPLSSLSATTVLFSCPTPNFSPPPSYPSRLHWFMNPIRR